MKRRNGAGSRQLADITEKFGKTQMRLVRILEEERLVSQKEAAALSCGIDRAAAQKRSADVIEAALSLNKKVIRALRADGCGEKVRQDSDLEILFEVSRLMQATLKRDEVCERLLDLVQEAVPYENATLFLTDSSTKQLAAVMERGHHVDLIGGVHFDQGSGLSGWVAKNRKPVLLAELHRGRQLDDVVVGSFISVPMVVQEELIGVLNLSHSRPRTFDSDHLRLLTLIAAQAAATIQRLLLYDEMHQLSITDDLTGLCNRRHFLERLQNEIDRAERYRLPFGLLFLDIDSFKDLNDSFGHQVGDRILGELGSVLKYWARRSDLVARYGGEEFIVLLPMTPKSRAYCAAERLREQVAQHVFYRRKKLTVSVGVAGYPDDGDTAERLLGRADEALYMAKKTGRNRACAFGQPLIAESVIS